MMIKNSREPIADKRKCCIKVNNLLVYFTTTRITYYGRMLLSLSNSLVGQSVRRVLLRQYCNGYYVVFHSQQ